MPSRNSAAAVAVAILDATAALLHQTWRLLRRLASTASRAITRRPRHP